MQQADSTGLDDFLAKWRRSGASERSNYEGYLKELCRVLGVSEPEAAGPDDEKNAYVFDRRVTFRDPLTGEASPRYIDLYKRGCFVLEAKQGSDKAGADPLLVAAKAGKKGTAVRGTKGWDRAMIAARGQAEQYARDLPPSEGWPAFLVVVDIGHTIETYADFSRMGKAYVPFPDALSHRIAHDDLARPEIRERLGLVWTDPQSLDPTRRSAKVTRQVAEKLARLAKSLEASGHPAEAVAQFLMRCLFTMFAEDVGLLPKDGFTHLLQGRRGKVASFPKMVKSLWTAMDRGEYSPILEVDVLKFNGQLFAVADALPLNDAQLELLIEAAEAEWRDVEPAIFGTLLERALDPIERHKLGAHYTPRAYVERLVMPTIIEPLRAEWDDVRVAAVTAMDEGKADDARAMVRDFLARLCETRVLDPACGTGNFLYVTFEHMKRLEGEVRDTLKDLGELKASFEGFGKTVDPHQLLGIEINPRAAAIADLVLWIGYLQWHFRTFGETTPAEPVLHAYKNIGSIASRPESPGTPARRAG